MALWLHSIESGRVTIGYWLVPTARGRQRAGWALRAAVSFAFETLAIPRLQLFIEPWNIASLKTAEFAGFSREAVLHGWERIGSTQRDVVCFAYLRDHWAERPES
jgi:[ribosomal protein S5]-alanine N-acetyltransferase